MYSGLEHRNRSIVGLIVIFALLFFCGYVARESHEEMEATRLDAENPAEQEKKDEEEEKRVIDPEKPMIALTFDDGPGKYTMQLLEQLETYDAKATFFMVGSNIAKYSDAVKKMWEIGCELGNHTMNHARLTKLENADITAEISGTNTELSGVVEQETTLLRPPYGSVDDRVSALVNAPLVMWSVDTRDWESRDAIAVRDYVIGTVQDGDIVLMHDIHETTVQATMELIPALIEQGYQLVTVSEMAKARGIELQNGVSYYFFKK